MKQMLKVCVLVLSPIVLASSLEAGQTVSKSSNSRVVSLVYHLGFWWPIVEGSRSEVRNSCAPEVEKTNVEVTEKTLREFAAMDEFASAEQFQEFLKRFEKLQKPSEKIFVIAQVVGIDPNREDFDKQLNYFLGARKEDIPAYANIAKRKLHLSDEQASKITESLIQKLRGTL